MSDSLRPWTIAHQALLPMEFLDKSTGVGCHFLLQGLNLDPRVELVSTALQTDSSSMSHLGNPTRIRKYFFKKEPFRAECNK